MYAKTYGVILSIYSAGIRFRGIFIALCWPADIFGCTTPFVAFITCSILTRAPVAHPGKTNVIRITQNGLFEGDIIIQNENLNYIKDQRLKKDITSFNFGDLKGKKRTFEKAKEAEYLLESVVKDGQVICAVETNLQKLQQRAADELKKLGKEYKRLANPHIYGVGLETKLYQTQQKLIEKHFKEK